MTSIINNAQDIFTAVYAHESVREVEFQLDWNNGTGYFDNLVDADLGLKPGQLARFNTGPGNNRKGIVVALPGGKNVVIFERYTAGQGGVYVSNAPRAVAEAFNLTSRVEDAAMARAFGQPLGWRFQPHDLKRANIGALLARVAEELQAEAAA